MIPLRIVVLLFLAAAGAVFALPADLRGGAWLVLLLGFVAVIAWASLGQRNQVLGPCATRGPSRGDRFALTFDDGPEPRCTPELLELLAQHDAQATFFLIGKHVEQHPDLAQRIHAAGHQLGNHSFDHRPWLTLALGGPLRRDLARCQATIEAATGTCPTWFRPPYGIRTHATQGATEQLGMRVAGWSAGGLDTLESRSTDSIVERICARLQPGAIVLLHDRGPAPERTLEITGRVLQEAERRGLASVTLDGLFA